MGPGTVIANRFEVERELGRGGMGVVLLAKHLVLEERVAIKLLIERSTDPTHAARFLREAKAMSRIKNEHVVRVLDAATLDDGTPFMVMEYIEGEDLEHAVKRRGALPVAEAIDYVLQACEGIAEAHALGIVHRDLKPANFFVAQRVDGTPCVKVLDFGISKVIGGDGAALTHTSSVMGTPLYMSPEQMRGGQPVTPAIDVWALGVVLYQLLSESVPFMGATVPEVCAKILSDPAPSLLLSRPELPAELAAVVMQCLEKDPARRFPSVAALAAALAPFAEQRSHASLEFIARASAVRAPAPPVSDPHSSQRFVTAPTAAIASTASAVARSTDEDAPKPKTALFVAVGVAAAAAVVVVGVGIFAINLHNAAPAASTSAPVTTATVAPQPSALPPEPSATSSSPPSASSNTVAEVPTPATVTTNVLKPHAHPPSTRHDAGGGRKYGGRE
jgi:serine/threonine-protein kinase